MKYKDYIKKHKDILDPIKYYVFDMMVAMKMMESAFKETRKIGRELRKKVMNSEIKEKIKTK